MLGTKIKRGSSKKEEKTIEKGKQTRRATNRERNGQSDRLIERPINIITKKKDKVQDRQTNRTRQTYGNK